MMNPLLDLAAHGQSYWLDNLSRHALRSGELARRVRHEGLRGVTSNPKTFHDAFVKDGVYHEELAALAQQGQATEQIYEALAVSDVRDACDVLRAVYDATERQDGFVSLEVSPRVAHDADAAVAEAERLARAVDRPNLMLKIPGNQAGVLAVERLLRAGINVNITLLFSVARYAEIAEAYLKALEGRQRDGQPIDGVRSVASFFLSRIDVLVDELLGQRAHGRGSPKSTSDRVLPYGKVAIANAKLAYQHFKTVFASERWAALERAGAQPQRLLWASTGTKSPAYRDVMYVEPLIGAQTISTMPEETISAFADHGVVADTLEQGAAEAAAVMSSLAELGIDFACAAIELENEGIKKFLEPETQVLERVAHERQRAQARTRVSALCDTATNVRRDIIRMTTEAGSGHPTSSSLPPIW